MAAGSRFAGIAVLAAAAALSCGSALRGGSEPALPAPQDPLASLHRYEEETRRATDFAHVRGAGTGLGPDPYVLRPLGSAGGSTFAGILRGRNAIVQLDAGLGELARMPAPDSPTGLAVGADGALYAVGELSSRVDRYRLDGGKLAQAGSIELPGVRGVRDVAAGPEGVLYVVEEHDGRLLTIGPSAWTAAAASTLDGLASDVAPTCHGPIHVMRVGRSVLVDCLLDHAIVIRSVDARGIPVTGTERRIVHDGPMWGLDAIEHGDSLLVAVGGVEDHPLDRTQGSFGFIDSFVTTYRVDAAGAVKVGEKNVSEMGIVTPKAVKLWQASPDHVSLAVAGYGSDRLAVLPVAQDGGLAAPEIPQDAVTTLTVPPGAVMMDRLDDGTFVLADPLLDAWVLASPASTRVVPVPDASSVPRSEASRMGEALFFTTLMAPWDRSDGRLSRFTCETCHFEGYVDGRIHRTGRGDIVATTKPLLGLFNNRPHFSRALDPDLTTMVNNEFRVAGAKSDHDPWFSLSVSDHPWEKDLFGANATLGPTDLRKDLMTFFMGFAHRPNPSVVGRSVWTPDERAGAATFRDRCEGCHQARLATDLPESRVPFDRWQELVLSPEGPLVWARAEYAKTGVLPYVNESGARVVSLRRLYKKYPYFTNGSAKGLEDVLDQASFAGDRFFHQGAPPGSTGLTREEKRTLRAFLDLL